MKEDIFININIVEGRFVIDKNVFSKMDTYCVIEIGNYQLETNICKNGGKYPVWNYKMNNINIPYNIEYLTIKA